MFEIRSMKTTFLCVSIILSMLWVSGCQRTIRRTHVDELMDQEKHLTQLEKEVTASMKDNALTNGEGSLYVASGPLSDLFVNQKARRVGDIVTVRIVESSEATNEASTSTGRTSSVTAGTDNFFGLEGEYPSTRGFFNPFGKVGASYNTAFDGNGSTTRSGDLKAIITARVVGVLQNGNLVIKGSREIRVNHEKQMITLSGMVRPADISSTNEIRSTAISDAKITYSGSGIVDDKQKPGWLLRLLDTVWPF